MRRHRRDVVEQALVVLDTWGLADLSMRRLAGELGVQPSALYHHFANKQTLLAAVADEILERGARPRRPGSWDALVTALCHELRDAMLAWRDGAELVATVRAFGLGGMRHETELRSVLESSGLDRQAVPVAVRTLLHFVLGHVSEEQTAMQAGSAGAIADGVRETSDFALGLDLVLDGIRARVGQGATRT